MSALINIFDLPKAIVHIDGDCFFASCEVAKDPSLKGKCVITGLERGIASSLSYEAKAKGVKRGMTLSEIKKICPSAIFLPSDYETYSLYSMRMYNIVKRYTSDVEEYSIDECFADLTGMRRPLNMSYEQIVQKIKNDLDEELGITFSVGLGPTKVLAKIGSKWKKPSGLTIITGRQIHNFLGKLPVGDVWGIGNQTSAYLNKCGIRTALQFVNKNEDWIKNNLTKPFYEIWQELRGQSVYELTVGQKHDYKSISKTKTFTPPSNNKEMVFSHLSKNVENACIKARRHKLAASKIFFFIKTQDFRYIGAELKLNHSSSLPNEILSLIRQYFDKIFRYNHLYRATGVILQGLTENNNRQLDLFGKVLKADKLNDIFFRSDKISEKYGKHTLFLGSSLNALTKSQHDNYRATNTTRQNNLLKGEDKRKKIGIPLLGVTV